VLLRLIHSNKFEANKWLVKARWFYAPAIFCMGLLLKFDPLGNNFFPIPTMMLLFFTFVLFNLFFYKQVKVAEIHNDLKLLNVLAVMQVAMELLFFLIILHLSGGDQSLAPIFFFIPIVTSIVLFDVLGSLIVSSVSAVFVNGILVLDYLGILKYVWGYPGSGVTEYYDFLVRIMSTTTYTAVYLIVGALAGYITSVIKKRDEILEDERRKSLLQADRLRMLNTEYGEYARKLVKEDLELKLENAKITALDKEKTQFVSNAAHQLRTPLSAIKWTLDLLLSEESAGLSTGARALIMKAYESNERVISLIRDMLGADNAEGGIAGQFFEISLTDLLDNIMLEFDAQLKRKKILVHIDSVSGIPRVSVDPQKMRAVFQNLLENAIKYTKSIITVSFALDKSKKNIIINFSDDGIGVPEADKEKIFTRFYRAANAISRDPDGNGLGLFIVKTIIERHNGTITLETEEGKGTKFVISLPIKRGRN
jgi:signal transduction histidine kinase